MCLVNVWLRASVRQECVGILHHRIEHEEYVFVYGMKIQYAYWNFFVCV